LAKQDVICDSSGEPRAELNKRADPRRISSSKPR